MRKAKEQGNAKCTLQTMQNDTGITEQVLRKQGSAPQFRLLEQFFSRSFRTLLINFALSIYNFLCRFHFACNKRQLFL